MFRILLIAVTIFITNSSYCQTKKDESNNKKLENGSNKFIRKLIREKRVAGAIYDSSRITLRLKSIDGEMEYLVDSVFRLRKAVANKIGFFAAFNDAASNTKFGYGEIIFNPYRTKVLFLNDSIHKITISKKKDHLEMLIHTSSFPRYEEKTEIVYSIKSYNSKLFLAGKHKEKNVKVKMN